MATVTVAPVIAYDLSNINFSNLLFAQSYLAASTHFIADYGNGIKDVFLGHGFTYNAEQTPVGGTVTSFGETVGSHLAVSVSGMHIPATTFVRTAETATTADDLRVIEIALSGADRLIGGRLADTIQGFGGNDRLSGFGSNDHLSGDAGNDTLAGGAGRDTLTGGTGDDTFVFNTRLGNSNVDAVQDFQHGLDKIDISHTVFQHMGAHGHLFSAFFHVGAAAADHSDHVLYNHATGALSYDSDGVGSNAPIEFAVLHNHPVLTAADFLVG